MNKPSEAARKAAKECAQLSTPGWIPRGAPIIEQAIREAAKPLVHALNHIASWGETTINGSYASFDEPRSAKTAREALSNWRKEHQE